MNMSNPTDTKLEEIERRNSPEMPAYIAHTDKQARALSDWMVNANEDRAFLMGAVRVLQRTMDRVCAENDRLRAILDAPVTEEMVAVSARRVERVLPFTDERLSMDEIKDIAREVFMSRASAVSK